MNGNRQVVYFDAGIFITWLANEERKDKNETIGVSELIANFDSNKIIVVTSTITITEVSRLKIHPDQLRKFDSLIGRQNYILQDVTRPVAHIANQIRDFYLKNRPSEDTVVLTPDAIHLACAIKNDCEYFYTFDEKDKEGKSRGLIPLSGTIAGRYFMQIGKPAPQKYQQRLF